MVIQTPTYIDLTAFEAFVHTRENRDRQFEYIRGRAVEVVSNPLSSKIAATIAGLLFIYLRANDIGHLTGADGGYVVGEGRYIPDVGFIRYEKQPRLASVEGYIPTAPDLAVEVISPSNDDADMAVKVADYLAMGSLVWLVRPKDRVVLVFRPGQPVQTLHEGDILHGEDLLPGLEIAVREIFPSDD